MKDIYSEAKVEMGPRMSYIVVNRKTQTRLFHNLGNPKPGALVDDVITKPERFVLKVYYILRLLFIFVIYSYDFFLVSNKPTRQGTVSPTSYNIIHDQCGLAPDRIQMLTYKMCHLYYNWSGTVRVPAVCQYAGKLSLLVAKYLHTTPSNLLEKQLYFL